MLKRKAEDNLLKLLSNSSNRQVIIIEGARQVGKTTLVRVVLSQMRRVIEINLETDLIILNDIEQTRSFEEFEQLIKVRLGFADEPGLVLFIDEAQESSVLGRYVRSFKESWSHSKVVLTGSSMTRLFREDQRIPVGRYTTFLLSPLTFYEFLSAMENGALAEIIDKVRNTLSFVDISPVIHHELLKVCDTYLNVGGLPKVVEEFLGGGEWKRRRREIYLSQEEDFIRKSGIDNRFLFSEGMKAVANHLGGVSKYTHIKSTYAEARKLMSALRAWKLIYEIEQKGIATTTEFFPKRYIYDVGIAQEIRQHPFPTLSILETIDVGLRTALGGLVENAVLTNLIQSTEPSLGISGWKKNRASQAEVDFVWRDEDVVPIECKASLKVSSRSYKSLMQYLNESGTSVGILVSAAPFERIKIQGKTLINVPIYLAEPEILGRLVSLNRSRTSS